MRAILTVVGPDRVGIIAEVCTLLARLNINVVDLSQTILQANFTMFMLVDISASTLDFDGIADALSEKGTEMGLSIRIQREDIFQAMHRV
jgi:ACT domain-containing protein